jgi:SAM-dependent methyltransferase
MLQRIAHECQEIGGEERSAEYAAHHAKYARMQFKAFLAGLQRQTNLRLATGRFLEIGSGPGFLTAIMAEHYPQAELTALELSPDMIAIARNVVAHSPHPSRVKFIAGSVDDRSLMSRLGKFDLVYSTFSLHHWEHPVQAIKTMYRALISGGLMLLHDFIRVPWLYLLPAQSGFIKSIRAAYRVDELKQMLQSADVPDYDIRTPFPFFWQTVSATA